MDAIGVADEVRADRTKPVTGHITILAKGVADKAERVVTNGGQHTEW
jgi:hypothetical protein